MQNVGKALATFLVGQIVPSFAIFLKIPEFVWIPTEVFVLIIAVGMWRQWGLLARILLASVAALILGIGMSLWAQLGAKPPDPTPPPSISDLEVLLIPESVSGENLLAHFQVRNEAKQVARILTYKILVPGVIGHMEDNDDPQDIPPRRTINIPIEPQNRLMRVKWITLEFEYSFGGKKGEQPAYVAFAIPADISQGKPIYSSRCCEKGAADLRFQSIYEANEAFKLPHGGLEFTVPERDENGNLVQLPLFNSKRILTMDFVSGVITYVHNPSGQAFTKWIKRRPKHRIYVGWNDVTGWAMLVVDDEEVKPDPIRRPNKYVIRANSS